MYRAGESVNNEADELRIKQQGIPPGVRAGRGGGMGVANTAGAVTLDTCIPSRVGGRTPASIQTTPGPVGGAETGRSTGSPAGPWCLEGPAAYPAS